MNSIDDVYSFPPFVSNRRDPLHKFSDGVFHKECLETTSIGNEALDRLRIYSENNQASERICRITGDSIDDPDDYFGLGYLTSRTENEVDQWNYAHFKKSALKNWSGLDSLIESIEVLRKYEEWESEGLDWIIHELQSFYSCKK